MKEVISAFVLFGVSTSVFAQTGADAIFNTCSSVGELADIMRQAVDIPLVKIDEPMATAAAAHGTEIAVIATVPTTLGQTSRLVERKGREIGKTITIQRRLVEGAFDVLVGGALTEQTDDC